jgi:modification methylase
MTVEHVTMLSDGVIIHGSFPDPDVLETIRSLTRDHGPFPLTIADPPYGNIVDDRWDRVATDDKVFCQWMIDWTKTVAELSLPNSALYVWGGVGIPHFRPFYRYMVEVELQTPYLVSNHITWAKKRAYGVQHNYLFTREELAYLVLGSDIKKPRLFQVPLLGAVRPYDGYNPKYPAKSKFYRRTNVWGDITELLRGKIHTAQKPRRCHEIPIETHTKPGEWVLDPFAGSGTTGEAARLLGRNFVLVEKDAKSYQLCVERMRRPAAAARLAE